MVNRIQDLQDSRNSDNKNEFVEQNNMASMCEQDDTKKLDQSKAVFNDRINYNSKLTL